jgi:hypothetical protein
MDDLYTPNKRGKLTVPLPSPANEQQPASLEPYTTALLPRL